MIYQLSIFSDIGFAIEQALRTFSGQIAAVLYNFIVYLYNIFMILARAEILNDNYIQAIYNRVGMILGLFMIFKLSFSLIQSLVNPEKLTDKKSGFGNIITRCIISIVLLGITPSLFKMAFKIQNIIVGTENDTNNIIYKFVVADAETENAATFGRTLATDLYFSFFTEKTEGIISDGNDIVIDPEGNTVLETKDYNYLRQSVKDGSLDFNDMVYYLSLRSNGTYAIKWDVLFSIGVAAAVIYILITYCISVATRVIQLAYLQLIAPVPILSYISDPEGTFKNWIKQCMTTYLDLFMRLAIIYFIIAVSRQILTIMSDESKLLSSTGLSPDSGEYIWVKIFLVLGLLMFGKRVPELLKDLFPNFGGGGAASIGFGIKNPKKMLGDIPGMGIAKGAATFGLGTVVGGAAGIATGIKHGEGFKGKLAGAFGGLGRGAASARTKGNIFKNAQAGMNSTRAARQRAYEKNHDGSTFWGRNVTSGSEARTFDNLERELDAYKDYDAQVSIIDKELEKNAYVQEAMSEKENLMKSGTATAAQIQAANDKIKAYKETVLQIEMSKKATGDSTANANISMALDNAEKIRSTGREKGYNGFDDQNVSIDAAAFDKNKKSSRNETNEITGASGSRNKEYKRAKSNSKYNKNGK